MRFSRNVVTFDFCGIPMAGNLANGFAVGLTPEGAALCARLTEEDVEPNAIRAVDPQLAECLEVGGFFEPANGNVSDSGKNFFESSSSRDGQPASNGPAAAVTPLRLAYLHVTQRCNLNCAGCYSLDEGRNRLADAPLEAMLRAVDQLASVGTSTLIVSGGETFLRPDLPQIVQRAKERGIGSVTVITNGTCVSGQMLEQLAPWVDTIAVSFDGWSADCPAPIRGQQRFEQLCDAVARIKAAGITAHITPTLHKGNAGDMQRYVELAQRLGATMNYSLLSCEPTDQLAPLIPGEEELLQLSVTLLAQGSMPSASGGPVGLNLTATANCGAGVSELSVGADGTVYPCHILMQPQYKLGNIFEQPVEEALARARELGFADLSVDRFEGCRECGVRYLCGGGCRGRSLFAHGDLQHPDGYCTMMRDYYQKLGVALAQQFSQPA